VGLTTVMLKKEAPHVVILGAGFAGLAAAKALRHAQVRITIIDRTNHHLFQPLLYQVAAAALAAPDISAPVRKLLARQENVTVWMATVERIDVEKKQVALEGLRVSLRARSPRSRGARWPATSSASIPARRASCSSKQVPESFRLSRKISRAKLNASSRSSG